MASIIEVDSFRRIITDDQAQIDKAITDGFTVTSIPIDPNAYAEDGSDRPEFVSQATRDQQKAEQDNINDTENKPRIISALDEMEYHERTKVQYDGFTYEILTSYFTLMVSKQNHIKEILELKFLEDTKANWDIEGAKTDADLQTEIADLKLNPPTRPLPPPPDNTDTIARIKTDLTTIPYPDKTQPEIDALSYEELTEYHSNMVHKQNLIYEIIVLNGDSPRQIAHWDIQGAKTYETLQTEIEALKSVV